MNNACTVGKSYIIVRNNIESRGVVLKEVENSLISNALELLALECLKYLIVLLEKGLNKGLGENKHVALIAYLAVILMGVYNESHV